jgi:hypothetical protein
LRVAATTLNCRPERNCHRVRGLIPPTRLALSQWVESNIRLPEGVSACQGFEPLAAAGIFGASPPAADVNDQATAATKISA